MTLPADQLLADLTAQGATVIAESREMGLTLPQPRLQKISYTHDAMIDLIIQRPDISQGELAELFGYTEGWVSIVKSSDAFQARLEERKGELVDPEIRATIEERFRAVTQQSLRVLAEKLAKPAQEVPDNLALRCAELGAKALGVGTAGATPPQRDGHDHLASLSHRLIDLLHRRGQPQGEVIDVSPQGDAA